MVAPLAAAALLNDARAAGIEIAARAGRLLVRGQVPPELRLRLREHRADLLRLLEAVRHPAPGWIHVKRGDLAGCWIGPSGQVASTPDYLDGDEVQP